jgi:hypothetical protein
VAMSFLSKTYSALSLVGSAVVMLADTSLRIFSKLALSTLAR